ncbi:hypothetical protein COW36_08580 [bacterium (Candidatus Blackallbacteria) CG17_big_fil_post_rev_8_21_14_2_50_48_46]|uniref:Protein kinase domain-containing protein n=1 Tax=bacterium (Candidatus Blackallbacteria) CG17_big_fil_post_rev_8_21_14_2_50_48_46 TaxID=2014261 RepID=A0A2M7G6A7_9BACT|nr:MAG: hypothetical protein COW64_05880 [bacterium (Candidatus Blackallbacteria) CG18_big_fil_WC_8_21_14_2_50_49_26]PIW17542.1 MAG: hypothetical protein COW36_08580 [bacterium (Candidatus Blackallbacteria) CG17_big_fil_post_rev_8_21_14_2_50_48_46]PIW48397.1 MAG: hypothetical protein COW20_09930 [bacterium (Candidatus Blackallbacteria) CG13_big_fil_rev_8_21_14_2_50_49_14]
MSGFHCPGIITFGMHTPENMLENTTGNQEWTVGDYTLLKELSSHIGSRLFLARNLQGKRVILKQYQADRRSNLSEEEQIQRFRRECEIHQFLHHPRIIPAIEVFEAQGLPCLVLEYIPAPNLEEKLKSGQRFTLLEALDLIQQLCQALHYLHEQGVIHRDIKPSNILVNNENRLFLTDFGCSRQVFAPQLTQTRMLQGTLAYMSPEQINCDVDLDYRTDLFSTGIVFYQLLTGQLPFTGEDQNDLAQNVLKSSPPSLQKLNPWIPASLESLIFKSLQKDRDYRIPTARKMAQEIELLLEDADIYYAEGRMRLEELHQADAGREYCLLALQKNGYHLPSLKMLGHIYQERKEWPRARRCFERILETAKDDPSIYFALGQIEKAEGFIESACVLHEQAWKLDPQNKNYHFEVAHLLHKLNRRYEALAHFQQLMQTWPDWAPPYAEVAHIYYLEGHRETALDHYRKAAELDPAHPPTRYAQATLAHEMGFYHEALNLYQMLLKAQPESHEIRHNLANLYYHLGEYAQANKMIQNLLNEAEWPHLPEWEMSYRLQGFIYARLNQHENAIEAFKHAILSRPDQLDAYLYLAFAYRECLRLEDAVKTLVYVSQLPVGASEASVYFLLARAYYEQGKEKESLRALEQCQACTHTLSTAMAQQIQQDIQFLKHKLSLANPENDLALQTELKNTRQQTLLLFSKPLKNRQSAG